METLITLRKMDLHTDSVLSKYGRKETFAYTTQCLNSRLQSICMMFLWISLGVIPFFCKHFMNVHPTVLSIFRFVTHCSPFYRPPPAQELRGDSDWFGLVCWVLWHINLCRLFNAKSIFM